MGRATLRAAIAVALALVLGGAPAGATQPRTLTVGDEAELAAAVSSLAASGGTIVLRPRHYRSLYVGARPERPLRIVGTRGVRLERVLIDGARAVSLERVAIRPLGGDALLEVRSSTRIRLERLVVSAAGTARSASAVLDDAHGVTITRSDFNHCGDLAPEFVNCLLLRPRTSHVTVEWSRFHDCRGCDFVHGRFRSHLTLRGNRFERALPCRMGRVRCGHQDLVELFAGTWLRVERNRFGVYRLGGAQLYVTNGMDHALIRNNVFVGTDPHVPGYRARMGLVVGSAASQRMPLYARVVNNTILTGAERVDGYRGSLRMSSRYGGVPRAQRPLVANNVIGLLESPWPVCSVARMRANVVLRGRRCSRADRVGPGHLAPDGRPTARSRLLVDRADPRRAPSLDFTGRRRVGRPDVGAYEFRGAVTAARARSG